jgi:pyridoxine/pyridoxamine 5'-phosphate oxidase
MANWISIVRGNLATEYGDNPPVCTLATVDLRGRPTARSMILREVRKNDGALLFISDRRTRKDDHLRANPHAEVVFWLAMQGRQIRIRGEAAVVGAEQDDFMRRGWWEQISDASRGIFLWSCGKQDATQPPKPVDADAPMPSTFELIVVVPAEVEILDMTKTPYERTQYAQKDGAWNAEPLCP